MIIQKSAAKSFEESFLRVDLIQSGIADICEYFDNHGYTLPEALQVVNALKSTFDEEFKKRVEEAASKTTERVNKIK